MTPAALALWLAISGQVEPPHEATAVVEPPRQAPSTHDATPVAQSPRQASSTQGATSVAEPARQAPSMQGATPVAEPARQAPSTQNATPVAEPVRQAPSTQGATPVAEPVRQAPSTQGSTPVAQPGRGVPPREEVTSAAASGGEPSRHVETRSRARLRGALELASLSFPSGPPGGSQDLFVFAAPLISFDGGEDFGLQLGVGLRLRVFDDPPAQRDRDHQGILRREDWDQLSDYGQFLHELRAGSDSSAVSLRAGMFGAYTLGTGQLVSRYSNRASADYHPASARAVLAIGLTRTELFASDVLGGRIFGGELAVDVGRMVNREEMQGRYQIAISAVHDAGRAGGAAPPLTLGWLEGAAALVREPRARMDAYAGVGARALDDGSSMGATLGISAEGEPRPLRLGGRLEARKQNGRFRQGMIGADYELSRFSAIGLGLAPIAEEQLPDGFSFRSELSLEAGGEERDPALAFSASGEYFLFGRTLFDLSLRTHAFDGKAALGARMAVTGLGQAPRTLVSLEGRYRFAASLYAIATGGTVFFPQPDGTLARGVQVGCGVGADFER
jgi:hypothetical protein